MPKKKGRNARNKHEDEDDKFDMGNVKEGLDDVEGLSFYALDNLAWCIRNRSTGFPCIF